MPSGNGTISRAACEELNGLAPQPGEEETLAAKRQAILASGKVRADLEAAADALVGPAFSREQSSAASYAGLNASLTCPKRLKPVLAALERVMIEAEEARALVEAQLRDGRRRTMPRPSRSGCSSFGRWRESIAFR